MTKKEREELYDNAKRKFIESPEGITISALAREFKGVNYNTLLSRSNREKWNDSRNLYILNARKATENLSILTAAQPKTTKIAISAMEAGLVRGVQLLKAMTVEGQPMSPSKNNVALFAQVGNTLSNLIRTAGDVGLLEQIEKPEKCGKDGEGDSNNSPLDPTILQQINIHLMATPSLLPPKQVEQVLADKPKEKESIVVDVEDADDDLEAGDV